MGVESGGGGGGGGGGGAGDASPAVKKSTGGCSPRNYVISVFFPSHK